MKGVVSGTDCASLASTVATSITIDSSMTLNALMLELNGASYQDQVIRIHGRFISADQFSNLNLVHELGLQAYDEIIVESAIAARSCLLGGSKHATFSSSTSSSNGCSEEEKDQIFDSHDESGD